tara:strand:+ start:175 stop:564 length:390 start_codon:yes stop_codon:yes gene_type:complete
MDMFQAIGRRKRSIARVYLKKGNGSIEINNKKLEDYFKLINHRNNLKTPFEIIKSEISNYDLSINVSGGGITGQSEAIRLAISRALVKENAENKTLLKHVKFLTRDSRVVERKKPGQKKARKKFQWVKR